MEFLREKDRRAIYSSELHWLLLSALDNSESDRIFVEEGELSSRIGKNRLQFLFKMATRRTRKWLNVKERKSKFAVRQTTRSEILHVEEEGY